jgi:SHS2 domain-containing protein
MFLNSLEEAAFQQPDCPDIHTGSLSAMKRYEFFDHTADIGLHVFGRSLPELFENAGFALFDIITDIKTVQERQQRSFALQRDSLDELLAEWLGGLLFISAAELFLCRRFHVSRIDGKSLQAEAWGEPLQEPRHVIKTEVKAVTYHNLRVYEEQGLWHAIVVLDI